VTRLGDQPAGSPDDARGLPVPADAVDELAHLVRDAGADDLADRLDRASDCRVPDDLKTHVDDEAVLGLLPLASMIW
jgi:hypothetical protein